MIAETPAQEVVRSGNSRAVLEARDLVRAYGSREVVSGVSFDLREGEVLGLLGPNGAGKTTIVQMLYGLTLPSTGTIKFSTLYMPRDARRIRKILGIVPQEDSLDTDFSAADNLMRFIHHAGVTGARAKKRVDEVLVQVGLEHHASKMVEQLSGGMKRRLVLARALLIEPEILFLDEPTTGLDPEARQALWHVVKNLKKEGTAILLTTHYMDEAERLCDRILLLKEGKIVDEGAPRELVERFIGQRVMEVEGIEEQELQQIVDQHQGTWQRFGGGFVIPLTGENTERIWEVLNQRRDLSILRRRGNLEDVFIRLTGEGLHGGAD